MEFEPDTFNDAAKGNAPVDMWPRTRAALPVLLAAMANDTERHMQSLAVVHQWRQGRDSTDPAYPEMREKISGDMTWQMKAMEAWVASLRMGVKAACDDDYWLETPAPIERDYLYFFDSAPLIDRHGRKNAFVLAMRQGGMYAFEMDAYNARYGSQSIEDSIVKELSWKGVFGQDIKDEDAFGIMHLSLDGRRQADIRRGIEKVIVDITRHVVRYGLSPDGKTEVFSWGEGTYMNMIAQPLYDDVYAYLSQQVLRVDPVHGALLLESQKTEAYNWVYRAQNDEIKVRRVNAIQQWGRSVHALLFPIDPMYHRREKTLWSTTRKITYMPRHIERDIDAGMDPASVAAASLGVSPAFYSAHVQDLYSCNGTIETYYTTPMLLLPLLEQLPEADWIAKKKDARWDSLYNLMHFAEDVVGRMKFSEMESEPNVVGPFWAALARHIDPQSIRLFLNTPYRPETSDQEFYNGCIYPHSKRNVEHLQSIFDRTDVVEGIGKYLLMPTLDVILKDMGMQAQEIQKIAGDIKTLAQGLYNGMSGQVDAARMIETWYNVMPVIQIKAFGQTLLDGTAGKPVADTEIIKAYGYDPREADIAGAVLDMFRPLLPSLLQDADTITDVIMAALPHSELGKKLQALHGKIERQVSRLKGPQLRL